MIEPRGAAGPIDAARQTEPPRQAEQSKPSGLAALEERLRQDLAWLELPAKPWVVARTHHGAPLLDVVIIGAGMSGLTAAAALRFLGIKPVVYDRSPQGFEGPWATTARMDTLRSPKQLTGPALGLGALSFRAWYEAQFGLAAWQALEKIPRLQWMDYLRWYRRVLDIEVRNDHQVEQVLPRPDARVELRMRHGEHRFTVQARRVVLATGRDGLGGPWMPEYAQQISRERRAHSADLLDYASLFGKRVAVIGASASAMDSAATALEAGARAVDLLMRRVELPRINKGKGAGSPGMTHGYHQLPDDWKWRIRRYVNTQQTPPPRGSTLRVSQHSNARFLLACPVSAAGEDTRLSALTETNVEASKDVNPVAEQVADQLANRVTNQETGSIWLQTPRGRLNYDFVIFCTGFRVNFADRPEFRSFADQIRFWRDRFSPKPGDEDEELSESPDLGSVFEFREKQPGACPGLSRIHCFCYPAVLSHGQLSGDIPAISDGAQRLAQGLASLLFQEDIGRHYELMQQYSEPELFGDEWVAS